MTPDPRPDDATNSSRHGWRPSPVQTLFGIVGALILVAVGVVVIDKTVMSVRCSNAFRAGEPTQCDAQGMKRFSKRMDELGIDADGITGLALVCGDLDDGQPETAIEADLNNPAPLSGPYTEREQRLIYTTAVEEICPEYGAPGPIDPP